MLFILVADSLHRFLRNMDSVMPTQVILKPEVIQYADDTLIISEAHPVIIKIIKHVLECSLS